MTKKIVVIGAGLGGISAAISLKAKGFEVAIYEKNSHLGGKLNQLKTQGFSFDLGPSIYTLPEIFDRLFEMHQKKRQDYYQICPVTPHWRNFFPDGKTIDLYYRPEEMAAELRAKLDEQSVQELQKFLAYSRQQYDYSARGYFEKGLDTLWDFFKFYGPFGMNKNFDYQHTMAETIANYFTSPYLRDIFEYFIKYVGSSAYQAPGYMNLMPHIQFHYDLWYAPGGMYQVANGLTKLLHDLQIPVYLDKEVVTIITKGKRVEGIKTKTGDTILADGVVSNMEVIPTYQKLLQEKSGFLKKLDKFEPACSGIVLHLGVNRIYPQLAHHNFFYSQNQKKHFETVFVKKQLPDDPTIYLVAPTRTDPSQAPSGHDNIKILPHIPYLYSGNTFTNEDYLQLKERVLIKLESMGLTDLRQHIVVEDFWTPIDIQKKYYSNGGAIYGVVSDWKKNWGFKAPKKSGRYQNLFFVGGSVNPGGGMPMVILSGQKVADLIAQTTL